MKILATVFTILLFNPLFLYAEDVHVGIMAIRGDKAMYKKWGETIRFLDRNIKEVDFKITPLNLETAEENVKSKSLHFILTNTGNYLTLKKYGLYSLANLNNKRLGRPVNKFGAVVFTRADRRDISSIEDFKGKSFAAVYPNAFGGFQMAWYLFYRHGIDPYRDFSKIEFPGFPQDGIVHKVLNREVDCGTVRTDVLERMAAEGKININDIKVVNRRNVPGFPFLLSTELYPEWPFAASTHTDPVLAGKVKKYLLEITPHSTPAQKGKYYGWSDEEQTVALFTLERLSQAEIGSNNLFTGRFESIEDMMKNLKTGIYSEKGKEKGLGQQKNP